MFCRLAVPTNAAERYLFARAISGQLLRRVGGIEREQQHSKLSWIHRRASERGLELINIRDARAWTASIDRQEDNRKTAEFRQASDLASVVSRLIAVTERPRCGEISSTLAAKHAEQKQGRQRLSGRFSLQRSHGLRVVVIGRGLIRQVTWRAGKIASNCLCDRSSVGDNEQERSPGQPWRKSCTAGMRSS